MRRISFVIFLFLCLVEANAQLSEQAETLFFDKQYREASEIYSQLVARNPRSLLYNYRYARCQYELHHYDEAINYFTKSGNKYPLTNFYLAESYFRSYRFADSQSAFARYQETIDTTNANWEIVEQRLRQCQLGQKLIKHVRNIEVIDSVLVSKNQFLSAYKLSSEAGTLSSDENGHITYLNGKGNRKIKAYRDSLHSTQLYSSEKLIKGWTQDMPFFGANDYNIDYPFLLTDGISLYYGANNSDGMGGYDIYTTRYNPTNNEFLKPENIGFPFNSPNNDYMMAIDENAGIAYFATDRNASKDSVYVFSFVWSDNAVYLAQDNDTILRLTAQLKQFDKAVISATEITPITSTEEQTPKSAKELFRFIITDEKVYTTYSDFKNKKALEQYKIYEADLQKYNRNKEKLDTLRSEYANSDAKHRAQISNTILALEQMIITQETNLHKAENNIRQLELPL